MELKKAFQNMVMSGCLSEGIDLKTVKKTFKNSRFKGRFPGLIIKRKKPKATILLFRSGSFVCTGVKNKEDGKKAVNKLLEALKEEKIVSVHCRYEMAIQNIVASVSLNTPLDIERFVEKFRNVVYEPEEFPAATYRMGKPHATFLIFPGGKVTCSGARSQKTLSEALDKFYTQLQEKGLINAPQKDWGSVETTAL